MKKLHLFFIAISLVFVSCKNTTSSSVTNTTLSDAEMFLKSQLKDPGSYENVSIKIADTVRLSEFTARDTDVDCSISQIISEKKEDAYKFTDDSIDGVKDDKSKMPWIKLQTKRDSLIKIINAYKTHPETNKIKYISVAIQYRAKNSFGALTLEQSTVYDFLIPTPNGTKFVIETK